MSSHPNALLVLILTPDDLARQTYRAILAGAGIGKDDDLKLCDGCLLSHKVMEDNYDDGIQIKAPEGSIVFYSFLTYGYGERITWDKAQSFKETIEKWAIGVCERHHCNYEISIGANYW